MRRRQVHKRGSVKQPTTIEHTLLRCGRFPMVALIQTLAVAEYLSFHRAARMLSTSQSSVSQRIRALEEDLGVVLFDRNTRGVRLTEAGRHFVDQISDALGIIDFAIITAGMQARGEEGNLRIGVHALTPGCFLDRLFEHFHTEHPCIRLDIAECTAREAQIMLRESRLDLAFMACTHEIHDLSSRVIWRDRLMVALSAGHPLAALSEVGWRQLAQETFLIRYSGTGPQVLDLILLRSAGKWPTPAIRRVDVGRSALLSMIAAGHGVSLFAEEGAAFNMANVVFLPVHDEPDAIAFSAVWLPGNRDPAIVKLLALAMETNRHSTQG
jgi:DNA-binding transcriptional LysR family regulator